MTEKKDDKGWRRRPSLHQDNRYYWLFDYFNDELFEVRLERLKHPYLVLSRNSNIIGGYFSQDRWVNDEGEKVHELAINANLMHEEDMKKLFTTLIHEMLHLWQQDHGSPGRTGYHNKEFAEASLKIGLRVINVQDESKNTGQMVRTELIKNKLAERAILDVPDEYLFPWLAVDELNTEEGQGGGGGSGPGGEGKEGPPGGIPGGENEREPRKKGRRSKYTCAECGLNAWAKPGVSLRCGSCDRIMVEHEK